MPETTTRPAPTPLSDRAALIIAGIVGAVVITVASFILTGYWMRVEADKVTADARAIEAATEFCDDAFTYESDADCITDVRSIRP